MQDHDHDGPSLETDFERFRTHGDAGAMARVFDRSAPQLLLLAGHLFGDANEAEDLVQTTFLVALRDRDQWDRSKPLRPWLNGILTHRALDLCRRERMRKMEPIQDVAAGSDPLELAADAERIEAVTRAIERIPDAQREPLILHIVHGLGPTEIAHALGRAPGTVRVQLARGREQLQPLLPRELKGAAVAVFSLADVRSTVLSKASVIPAPMTAPVPSVTTHFATIAMPTKTISLALLCLALVVAGWFTFAQSGAESGATHTANPGRDAGLPGGGANPSGPKDVVPQSSLAERTTAAAVPPPATKVALTTRVVFADGSTAEDVGVHLARSIGNDLGRGRRTGSDGTTQFNDLAPGKYLVDLDRWNSVPVPVDLIGDRIGASALTLTLPAGVEILGTVLTHGGAPVPGARVYRVSLAHPDRLHRVAISANDGTFRIQHVAPGTELCARADGHQPSIGRRGDAGTKVHGEPGGTERLALQLGAKGYFVHGHVRHPNGDPAPHALLVFAVDEDAREGADGIDLRDRTRRQGSKPDDFETFTVRADAEGAFATTEVPRGSGSVFARSGSMVAGQAFGMTGARETILELVLGPGAEVFGQARDANGTPLRGFLMETDWAGTTALGGLEAGVGIDVINRRVRTDEEGRYRLRGLLAGDTRFTMRSATGGTLARHRIDLPAVGSQEWSPRVDMPAKLNVRVVDASGAAIPGWSVGYEWSPSSGTTRSLKDHLTDGEGRTEFNDLESWASVLSVHPPAGPAAKSAPVPVFAVRTAPADNELLVRLDPKPTANVRGRVSPQHAASGVRVQLVYGEFDQCGEQSIEKDGSFAYVSLAAGSYRLRFVGRGQPRDTDAVTFELGPGQQLDLGSVEPPAGTIVLVNFETGGRPLPARLDLQIRTEGEKAAQWGRPMHRVEGTETFASAPMGQGAHYVILCAKGFPLQRWRVLVDPQQATPEESTDGAEYLYQREVLTVSRGREVLFDVTFQREPDGLEVRSRAEPGQGRVDLILKDGDGVPLEDDRIDQDYEDPRARRMLLRRQLLPGAYRLHVQDERYDGWSKPEGSVTFTVPPTGDSTDGGPIIVPLTLQ